MGQRSKVKKGIRKKGHLHRSSCQHGVMVKKTKLVDKSFIFFISRGLFLRGEKRVEYCSDNFYPKDLKLSYIKNH
jgi:hypothetical protein